MTYEHRHELIDKELELIVEIGDEEAESRLRHRDKFIETAPEYLQNDQSWDFYAYSYGAAFDVIWDAAWQNRTVLYPSLLLIFRQSIELSLKASIFKLSGEKPPQGHKLSSLWSALLKAIDKQGLPTSAVYSECVGKRIKLLDQHDHIGD